MNRKVIKSPRTEHDLIEHFAYIAMDKNSTRRTGSWPSPKKHFERSPTRRLLGVN